MLEKQSLESYTNVNPVTKYILEDLKRKYGDSIADPQKTILSLTNPPGSAGHVTTMDADEKGKVDTTRINPQAERDIVGNLTVDRIRQVERDIEAIKNNIKTIDDTDDDFKDDVVRIFNAYHSLGRLSGHELAHSKPTFKGEEFAGEDVAKMEEDKIGQKILNDIMNNTPDEISKYIKVNAEQEYIFVKRMMKVAEELDNSGRSEIAKEIEDFIIESFNYRRV